MWSARLESAPPDPSSAVRLCDGQTILDAARADPNRQWERRIHKRALQFRVLCLYLKRLQADHTPSLRAKPIQSHQNAMGTQRHRPFGTIRVALRKNMEEPT